MRLLLAITLFIVALGLNVPAQSPDIDRPVFTAVDMNGAKVDIAALKGKIVVLNLWFINCPNCTWRRSRC